MKIDIAGKRAIVAGGSRGIGRAIALAFAEAGAGVSICARGAEALAATRDEIARHDGVAHASVCDLSDAAAIPRYIAEAADALGGIDILVNNASGFGTSDDEAGWAASISVDLLAPAYGAVKAAMIHYTASQAAMLARQGIRVNCIAPGSIEFPGGTWERRRLDGDPLYTRVKERIPFGRLGTPEEIAEVALFLASPHARWITGQTIVVDGGQLLSS